MVFNLTVKRGAECVISFDFRSKMFPISGFRTWDHGNSGLIAVAIKQATRAANLDGLIWVYIATYSFKNLSVISLLVD